MPRTWKLEDAKARFSEVVRLARSEGPQRVTVRGRDAVVVVAAEEMARLRPEPGETAASLLAFLRGLDFHELDLEPRQRDVGREPPDLAAWDEETGAADPAAGGPRP